MTEWNEFFRHLEQLNMLNHCDGTHNKLELFCVANSLDTEVVKRLVRSYGGYCDCEILLNMEDRIEYKTIPTTLDEMKKQLGPSDDEPRPDDTFAFLAENGTLGWTDGFKTREEAEDAMLQMKNKGIKIMSGVSIDINARIMRNSKK